MKLRTAVIGLGVAVFAGTAAGQSCTIVPTTPDHERNPFAFNVTNSDAEIAVGHTCILTCSNAYLRLLDKSGQLLSTPGQARMADYDDPTSTDPAFFAVEHPSNTREHAHIADPVVYYDQEHHRFWVVAIEWKEKNIISFPLPFNYAHVQIAVSTTDTPANWMNINNTNNTTGNPSGHWYKYDFCLWEENGNCSNLHGVGHNQTIYVDDDTLYIAFLDDEGTTNVKSTTLMMVDKDTLMNGTATQTDAQFIQLKNIDDTWGHALAVEYDAWNNTDPVYTIVPEINSQIAFGFQDTLTLGAITKSSTLPHTYAYESTPVTGGLLPEWFNTRTNAASNGVTLPTGTQGVTSRSILHATYRSDPIVGGRLWTCHSVWPVDPNSVAEPVPLEERVVRWYEIHTNGWPMDPNATPLVAQVGEIALPGGDAYDPSIAVNAFKDVVLTWTEGSPTMNQTFRMGVHQAGDPAGVLGTTWTIGASQTSNYLNPADYSGTNVDPANWCQFWGHSTLGASNQDWETYVARVCMPLCPFDCYADQDDDGDLDVMDPVTFANYYNANDPSADCDGNGVVDTFDVLCFDALFQAGCP